MTEAKLWWKPKAIKEKSKIFRKYFSSGVTCLMDLTDNEIEQVYVYETTIQIADEGSKGKRRQKKIKYNIDEAEK